MKQLTKIIDKIKKYVKIEDLSQIKQEKIQEIVEKLSLKKAQLKQDIKVCEDKLHKEKLEKEFETVSKLLKKSKKL